MKNTHPSDSTVQRQVERIVVQLLEKRYSCKFNSDYIVLDELKNIKLQVDAYNIDKKIFIEIYAGTKQIKPAQIKKVIADGLKLLTVEKILYQDKGCQKIICFVDEDILRKVQSNNWYNMAFEKFGIELIIQEISPKEKIKLFKAKAIQYR